MNKVVRIAKEMTHLTNNLLERFGASAATRYKSPQQ